MLEGYWELYPVTEGIRTLLLCQLAVDPGIPVPARVVKNYLQKSLLEALVSLRGQVFLGESARRGAVTHWINRPKIHPFLFETRRT